MACPNFFHMGKHRIAIFTSDDYTWSFSAWKRTIPEFFARYDVVGIYLFSDVLHGLKGWQILFWYLRTFGLLTFLLLALHAIKTRYLEIFSGIYTWQQLADAHHIALHYAATPNAPEVCIWVKENNIDIIFITVGQILKKDIINVPNIGIINKHAAVLPSCRGLFPYLWAKFTNAPTGVTFHQVDATIDTGKILVQKRYDNGNASMLQFYKLVFSQFPALALQAAEHLVEKNYLPTPTDVQASYFGLPTKTDVKAYRKKGYYIARFIDLL